MASKQADRQRSHAERARLADVVSHRLRVARERAGLSQEELAVRARIAGGGQAISHFECGRRTPNAHHLAALSVALGVTADWLLGIICTEAEVLALLAFSGTVGPRVIEVTKVTRTGDGQ